MGCIGCVAFGWPSGPLGNRVIVNGRANVNRSEVSNILCPDFTCTIPSITRNYSHPFGILLTGDITHVERSLYRWDRIFSERRRSIGQSQIMSMTEVFTLRWISPDAATRDDLQELNLDRKICKSLARMFGTGLSKVFRRGTRGFWLSGRIISRGAIGFNNADTASKIPCTFFCGGMHVLGDSKLSCRR